MTAKNTLFAGWGAVPSLPSAASSPKAADEAAQFTYAVVESYARPHLRRQVRRIEAEAFGWPRLLFGIWPTITQPGKHLVAAYLAGSDAPPCLMTGYSLCVAKQMPQGQPAWYIESVGVARDFRRQGIGRDLVRLSCIGHDLTWLHVRQSNTVAIALYESLGFVTRQVGIEFYKNNGESALVMVLEGACRT